MDPVNVASVIVALVAAFAAIMTGRTSSKTSTENLRVQAEEEAYNRARKFDVDTITRQDAEIEEVRAEIREVRAVAKDVRAELTEVKNENVRLRAENRQLKARIARLEKKEKDHEQ